MNSCPYCHAVMDNPRRVQCGADECRRRYNNDRMKQFFADYEATHGEPYSQRYRRDGRMRQYQARWRQTESGQRSRRIGDATRRARKVGATVGDLIDRDDICARDNWKCGLCRRKIDRTLCWPHPDSASLDHIVPLAAGGQHSKANVQAAHLHCNLSKNTAARGEQLRLIG